MLDHMKDMSGEVGMSGDGSLILSPYHPDGEYSDQEVTQLIEFMHGATSNWITGGGRHGVLSIERPPADIVDPTRWDQFMELAILPEWQELHPKLRQKNIFVRFEPLISPTGVPAAHAMDIPMKNLPDGDRDEVWIRISTQMSGDQNRNEVQIFLDLAHEIAESDYYSKRPFGSEHHPPQDDEADNDMDYWNLEDEKIANRRSIRALQRLNPNMTADKVWKPEFVYPEDK